MRAEPALGPLALIRGHVLPDSRGEGNPLTFTQNDLRTVLEAVVKLRPSPGAGVSGVTVRVLAVKA